MFGFGTTITFLMLYLLRMATVESINVIDTQMSMSWTVHNSFSSMFIGDTSHKLALLKWNNTDKYYPNYVNLTVRTHSFGGKTYDKICDIALRPKNETEWIFPIDVTFLKTDRILLTWVERRKAAGERMVTHMKWQVIFVKMCKSSDYVHGNVQQGALGLYYAGKIRNVVVKFENTFEIMLVWPITCPLEGNSKKLCKIVLDYEGRVLSQVPIPGREDLQEKWYFAHRIYGMNYTGGDSYVFIDTNDGPGESIYSPIVGPIKVEQIDQHWRKSIFSNSSGFATFCWIGNIINLQDIHCKWLDGEREPNYTLTAELFADIHTTEIYIEPWILNLRNGNIVTMLAVTHDELCVILIKEIKLNGEDKLLDIILFPESNGLPRKAQLSIVDQDYYCISFFLDQSSQSKYRFVTTCSQWAEKKYGTHSES